MLFHSFAFFLFFCVTFVGYWALRVHEHRMRWLLGASIIFYAAWNPWFVPLIAFTAGVDYVFALRLLASKSAPPRLVILETYPDLLMRNNVYFDFIITRELTGADLPRYLGDILLSRNAISRLLSSRVTPFFRHRSEFLTWAREAVSKRPVEKMLPIEAIQSTPWEGNSFQYVRDQGERNHVPVAERIRVGAHHFESHLRPYQLAGGTSAAFEETVAMLRAHGCAIVLVEPPLCSARRALFTSEVRQRFDMFLQLLQTSYGCEFADYSATLPDTLFIDNHHLGNPGSFKFTELLAKEVVAPAWRKLVVHTVED